MISVLNHLRLLSGSKLLICCLILPFLFACGGAKKVIQTPTVPQVSQSDTKVDTVVWVEDTSAPDPIFSDEVGQEGAGELLVDGGVNVPSSEKLSSYNISVLFPFYSAAYNPENDRSRNKSKRAVQVYGGMQLAITKLEKEGVKMNINVFDTKGQTSTTNELLRRSDVYSSDVIFGPFRSDNLKLGAEIAQEIKKPFISPMNPSNKIAANNPFFIQVKPGLEAHCQAITDHLLESYKPVQVVLVVRDKVGEKERLQIFQDALTASGKAEKGEKFREYLVTDYGNEFENMAFENFIIEGAPTVFVVPSWSSESFINNVLRKIRLVKLENEVVVYGMPQWKNYERVSYDYYDVLNVHVSSDNQLDRSKDNIRNFARDYYNRFGEMPNEDAYYGYDMTLYMGKMLAKHGSQFQTQIDAEPFMGLSTGFDFETVYDLSEENLETAKIKYIENKHVDILHFKEFIFQAVK